jgi:hypothetical protein
MGSDLENSAIRNGICCVNADYVRMFRPESTEIIVYKNGDQVSSIILSDENNWECSLNNLPKYDEDWNEIEWTFGEAPGTWQENYISSYVSSLLETNVTEITYTNTLRDDVRIPVPTGNIVISACWADDNNNIYGLRPDLIQAYVISSDNSTSSIFSDVFELSPENNWSHTLSGVDLKAQDLITNISYIAATDYTNDNYKKCIELNTIKFSFQMPKISITGKKVWRDCNNKYYSRPDIAYLILNADEIISGDPVMVSSPYWAYVWDELPKYNTKTGKPIVYHVDEFSDAQNQLPSGYTPSLSGSTTVVNTFNVEKIYNQVQIIWSEDSTIDKDNSTTPSADIFKFRPESVTVNLYSVTNVNTESDKKLIKSIEISEETEWQYIFSGPKYDLDTGDEVTYIVECDKNIEQYSYYEHGASITFTFIMPTVEFQFTHEWVDENNKFNVRPEKYFVTARQNGGNSIYNTLEFPSNTTSGILTGLQKFNRIDGREIDYRISTETVDYYERIISGENNCLSGAHIIDKFRMPTISAMISASWIDSTNNQSFAQRPELIKVNVLSSILSGTNNIVSSNIELYSSNGWKRQIGGLPMFDEQTGKVINYSLSSQQIENYETTYDEFNITNKFIMPYFNFNGIKIWEDWNNKFKKRPSFVEIQLYKNNSKEGEPIIFSDFNNWSHTWEHLPRYNSSTGYEIPYRIDEVLPIKGYVKYVNEEKIVNKFSLNPVDIFVEIIWKDNFNSMNARPSGVSLTVLGNNKPLEYTYPDTNIQFPTSIIVTEKESWQATWYNAPTLNELNGDKLTLSVFEGPIDDYITSIYKKSPTHFIITNTYSKLRTDVKKLLNGYGIVSFNNEIEPSSIKYEYFNFENDLKSKLEKNEIYEIDIDLIPEEDEDHSLIQKFWIFNDDDNISSNSLIIVKNDYLEDFENLFAGPFDTNEEVMNFLSNFGNIENFKITYKS